MNVAEKVFAKVSAALPPNETLALNDLLSLPLSAQSQAFLLAELEFSARALIASLKSSRFDFQDDSLAEARNRFAREAVKTARFQRDDALKLLETVIRAEARYLARPQKVLKELVFADRAERRAADVKDRLRSFTEYDYLLHVFHQYLERKQPETLSAEKFETVISEIDSKLCATYSVEELLTLFKPLYDFYQRGDEKAVECDVLLDFLGEKRLADHVKRVELALQNDVKALTLAALNELFLAPMETLLPKPEPTPPTPEVALPKPNLQPASAAPSASIVETAPPARDETKPSAPEPVAQPAPQTPFSEVALAPPPPEAPKEKKIPQIDFFELEKQRLQAKRQQETSLRDVRLLISEDERKRFVKRLFKGSEAEYEKAIAAINDKKTWREASLYIDHEIFSRFKVDEFSSEAVAFVDIVFERYQNR
ncbi:MAG: hypothetical protein NZM06_04545 [Chloroherpetonaceae bacterium]|nr:hypothetical protein [Chloroherpetonaceae bacterium]MDW8436735.1 hypothetical protein [Chloroherpetonaceae bacterium]